MDEVNGSDATGSGSEAAPYKSALEAVIQLGGLDHLSILIKKEGSEEYAPIAKAASKKLQKNYDVYNRKKGKAETAAASAVTTKQVQEEAIVEDPTLPTAQKIKIRQAGEKHGVRVVVRGWVATVRVQSRKLVFIDLRDGSDLYLQCILAGPLVRSLRRLTTTG